MLTLRKKAAQAFGRFGNRVRPGDTDGIEALRSRVGDQARFQKSRSA
jgi:hypothetical protein